MTANAGTANRGRAGILRAAVLASTVWAYAGGAVLLAVVLVNVVSVVGGIFFKPFPGDFELTEVGVAIAAFSFLPYCQLTGANVTADIFTSKAPARIVGLLASLWAVVAALFAALLLWRMYDGLLSQKEYGYTTAILQIPVWTVYVPILVSLLLLVASSAVSVYCRADEEPEAASA